MTIHNLYLAVECTREQSSSRLISGSNRVSMPIYCLGGSEHDFTLGRCAADHSLCSL